MLLLLLACTPAPTGADPDAVPSSDSASDSAAPGDSGQAPAPPRVRVNELMSHNTGSVADDIGGSADWLELLNLEDTPVDLAGWSLSDDWTAPELVPLTLVLDPGEHHLLWADGAQAPDHVSFQLSRDGEGVGVFDDLGRAVDWVEFPALPADMAYARLPDGEDTWEQVSHGTPGAPNARVQEQTQTLVQAGATWSWWDAGTPPEGDWTAQDYDDSAWASGPAPLGYGDSQTTTVSYGDDARNKHVTTWFRHTFEADASDRDSVTLSLRVDDGGVVYLNGAEIARYRMADGEVSADTLASATASGEGETSYVDFDVDPSLVVTGENVLAVEVHQVSVSSSDITLDLALEAVGWVEAG